MPVGILSWRIELDDPCMIHCANPISGKVALRYSPITNPELFGPLQVTVTLDGRAKTKLWKEKGESTKLYRGRAPLIHLAFNIHNGPLRLVPGATQKYPFTLIFPDCVDQSTALQKWRYDPSFDTSPNAPLPPSMLLGHRDLGHRFLCFCEYRVNAIVSMPQIDVKINKFGSPEGREVYYQPTRVSLSNQPINTPLLLRKTVKTRNKYLLPEEQRPVGFIQHAKNFFNSDAYPSFVYSVAIDSVADLYINQPARFQLSLRPELDQSTAPELPVMTVVSFKVNLKAHTKVRAESLLFDETASGCETVMTFEARPIESGDFSEANDFTKTFETTGAVVNLPSTFSTAIITRTYTIMLSISIEAANKTKKIKQEFRVNVLPPTNTSPAAGIPSPADAAEPWPSEEQLPEYQAPPTYEDRRTP